MPCSFQISLTPSRPNISNHVQGVCRLSNLPWKTSFWEAEGPCVTSYRDFYVLDSLCILFSWVSVLLFCCLVLFFSVSLVCSCVYVHLLSPVLHHPVCRLLSVYFSSCFILKYFLLVSGHLYLLCLIISWISPLSRFPHLCLVCNHSPCIYCPVFSSVLVESTAFILFLFYVYSMFIPCSWLVFLCLCLLRFWYVPVTSALNISASDLACLPSLHLGPPAPLTHLRDTMWDSWTLRFCFGACLKS